MRKSSQSLIWGNPDRGMFVACLLGAIVPLAALGFVIGRHAAMHSEASAADPGLALLAPSPLLWLCVGISSLSLACFFLFRRRVDRTLEETPRIAQFDHLTGLPSHRLFEDRVGQALLHSRREGALFAVCFMGIDAFKGVNDTLGHEVGDRLLCEVANRLVGVVRLSDSIARVEPSDSRMGVARLGGDEFTLLLTGISNAFDAERVARRVLAALRVPFRVAGHEIVVTASLGIGIYPFDGEDLETLLKNAQSAMRSAKQEGRNNCRFFSTSLNDKAKRMLDLEDRLRGALSRNELSVHYQPVRDAKTARVVAAEALVRWTDPEVGRVGPDEFIPIAEHTGLINPIGEFVLQTACAQARAWQVAGLRPIRMAVNVSGYQIRKPGFVEKVRQTLEETGLGAAQLELEITESTIMQEDERTDAAFEALGNMGVGLALDDFGTGYSSLTYLRRFPISRVKVDRSFVEGIPGNAENFATASAIISMAHHLAMSVVAEGVEEQEQAQSLRELGCEELQGFLFSPAVPADEFVRFLEREKQD